MRQNAQPTLSLEASVVCEAGRVTLRDLLDGRADVEGQQDPLEPVLAADRQRALQAAMDALLSDTQRQVLQMRFGLDPCTGPLTLAEIGRVLGVTRERIRHIELKALNSLLTYGDDYGLYEHLVEGSAEEHVVSPARRVCQTAPTPCTGAWPSSREQPSIVEAVRAVRRPRTQAEDHLLT